MTHATKAMAFKLCSIKGCHCAREDSNGMVHVEGQGECGYMPREMATLLIASPSMIDDLKMAECEMVTLMPRLSAGYRSNLEAAVKRIRATIAKAEGTTSRL
jgi:hypothetical protein